MKARDAAREVARRPSFLRALEMVIEQEPELVRGLQASTRGLTDLESRLLAESGVNLEPREMFPNPLERTAAEYAQILESSLSVAEAAMLLGVEPARIRQRLADRSLYGLKGSAREWRVPRFQFLENEGEVPGLKAVLRALDPSLHPVEVARWLRLPNPDLEMHDEAVSPVQWLLAGGEPDRVAELAGHLGEAH